MLSHKTQTVEYLFSTLQVQNCIEIPYVFQTLPNTWSLSNRSSSISTGVSKWFRHEEHIDRLYTAQVCVGWPSCHIHKAIDLDTDWRELVTLVGRCRIVLHTLQLSLRSTAVRYLKWFSQISNWHKFMRSKLKNPARKRRYSSVERKSFDEVDAKSKLPSAVLLPPHDT